MLGGTEHLDHVHWNVIPEASTQLWSGYDFQHRDLGCGSGLTPAFTYQRLSRFCSDVLFTGGKLVSSVGVSEQGSAEEPGGRAVSSRYCCPPVELLEKAANATNFGGFMGYGRDIHYSFSLSQRSWDKDTNPCLEVTLYNRALPREPSSHHILWDMGWRGGKEV